MTTKVHGCVLRELPEIRPASRMRRSSWSPSGAGAYSRTSRRLAIANQASTGRRVLGGQVRERVGVQPGPARLALVERRDLVDVLGSELEVEELEVLADARGRGRLREHDAPALQVPAQDDLGRGAIEPRGDAGDHRVVEDVALGDRRPRLGRDPVRLAVRPDVLVEEVGVQLD